MNNNTHKLSIAFNLLLLLVCCVTSTYAQPAKGAPENPSRQPGQERRRPTTDNYDRGAVAEATAQPLNSVRVTIRYKNEYGYKWESGTVAGTGPTSCAAFAVSPNISVGRGGVLIPVTREDKMRDEYGYYFCDFLVAELPFDKQVTITAKMFDESLTEAWQGGSQPQPASGWRRAVDEGSRTVTLTTNEPRATMNFEMIYQLHQPSGARQEPRRAQGTSVIGKP